MEARWIEVDDYFAALFAPEDAALAATLAASDVAGLPSINVTASQSS